MSTAANTTTYPSCPACAGAAIKWGKDRGGHQRFRCKNCTQTFADRPERPLGSMRLPVNRAELVLSLLVEGMSIRAAERITGHHRDTICRLLVKVGGKCEALLYNMIKDVAVNDVQANELWAYVGMKEKTKKSREIEDNKLGDSYTYVAMERDSKLILAHHVGRRVWNDAELFVSKLDQATKRTFQLSTDGFDGYKWPVRQYLGHRVDYAQIIKDFGADSEGQRRYSPPKIIGTRKEYRTGFADPDRVCTSHVERQNLTIRMSCRRFTRLTNAFSKKWENLKAAVSLHVAHYNPCRIHSSIRCTPAMAAGVTGTVWGIGDLLAT